MTRFLAVPLALLAAALPAFGQDEVQKLKQELQDRNEYIRALQEKINQLDAELRKPKAPVVTPVPAPVVTVPAPVPVPKASEELKKAAAPALEAVRRKPEDLAARKFYLDALKFLEMPKKPVEGKVSAVAAEIGLVVLSVGTDDGALEGDEYTVYRAGDFVAKVVIDRCDRKWSAGKITLKKQDPRVGDDLSNHIFVSAPRAVPDPVALRDIRRELDEIRKQVRELSGQLLPAWARAGVAVEEAPEELREHLGVTQALLVKAVRAGSAADKAGLRVHDVVPRLSESQLVEALEKGSALGIVRQGKAQTLGGR